MGFLDSVKQFLGIGGIKVELRCPPQIPKAAGVVTGTVELFAKSDQHVQSLHVMLIEDWSTGRGEQKTERRFELGKINLDAPFELKANERKAVDFSLPFSLVKSNADELKDMGGAMGKLGSLAAMANAEKSEYKVIAEADVKGTALDPSDTVEVKLV